MYKLVVDQPNTDLYRNERTLLLLIGHHQIWNFVTFVTWPLAY